MKLPFLWLALGFSLGIVTEKYWNVPGGWLLCGVFPGILSLWLLRGRRLFLPLFVILLGCAGFLWARLDAHVPANAIQNYVGPERITLRGVVDTLPEIKTRGQKNTVSLVLKARSITRLESGRRKFRKVTGSVQAFLLQAPALPQVGDELRLYGELSAPRTVLNPGEFDYGIFLAQKNIHAVFQTIGRKCVRVTRAGNPWAPLRVLASARRYLAALVDKLYKPQEGAIVKALVLGLRSDISPEVRSQFMKTGTIHLLAISGMNITMIAGAFYLIFLFCGLEFRKASCVTILIVILYIGLAGAGIPVQRAGYGAALVLIAMLAGRPSHLLNALCLSFFVILVWDPQSLWNIGFQLSFLCVFSLILILPLLARVSAWALSLSSSLAVLFGTFPVVLYYFNIFSPVSVLANIVAIPLCDAALFTALFSLLFSGVPFLKIVLVKISSFIIGGSLAWVKWLSAWRWGYWFLERPSAGLLVAYYASIAAILFCYRRTFLGKRFLMTALVACWACSSVLFFAGSGEKGFELTLLSSGRNQLVHARFKNGAQWMINAGRNFPSDQGQWLVAPFLRSRGVQRLEGVLLTDLSKKNTGGLVSVLRDFPVSHLLYSGSFSYVPEELYRNLRARGRKAQGLRQGDEVRMGDEQMRVIAQSQKGTALLIASGPWRILLLSRCEEGLIRGLFQREEAETQIHAVYLPSGRDIPDEFYDWIGRTRPLLTVLSDAEPELVARLASYGIPFVDLRHTGALKFKKNGPRLELASFLKGPLGFFSYS
jgi:competence protein ComEC